MVRIQITSLMVIILVLAGVSGTRAQEAGSAILRVIEAGQPIDDARLSGQRKLDDAYHPWRPAETLDAWKNQAQRIRERILVSIGLWPMWPRQPLNAVIHGRIDRGDYTVEKVFFSSLPGHYVTGSLYRPRNATVRRPGILCPHGHWDKGRFHDAGEPVVAGQIETGAESNEAAARFPLQARMVHLARMGCVVFHYDMVGYADSTAIDHRSGFADAQAGLWLQNWMGLQTWNSIRALDFLQSLPDVDSARIGVTGGSGGGTQTFMLCAVDPRPAAAFPAVMVSTAMQGGCVCENSDYLRIGVNNIAFAALFAPKPLAMSGADDWTIEIETKGLPELRNVYSLFGRKDFVDAHTWPEHRHNYNQRARRFMYSWFRRHLEMGADVSTDEREFEPLAPAELSVFDDAHPLPVDAQDVTTLRAYLTKVFQRQFASLLPEADTGPNSIARYRKTVGTAARVMLGGPAPVAADLEIVRQPETSLGTARSLRGTVKRKLTGEFVPWITLVPKEFNGTVVAWFDGRGKQHLLDGESLSHAATQLLDAGFAVVSADVFLTGEFLNDARSKEARQIDERFAGYTFGYNHPLLAHRVRDILAVVSAATAQEGTERIHLAGTNGAGPWVLLARSLLGDRVERTAVDLDGFSFRSQALNDPDYLPGALRYGDIGGLAALAVPGDMTLFGSEGIPDAALLPLTELSKSAGGRLQMNSGNATAKDIANSLLR